MPFSILSLLFEYLSVSLLNVTLHCVFCFCFIPTDIALEHSTASYPSKENKREYQENYEQQVIPVREHVLPYGLQNEVACYQNYDWTEEPYEVRHVELACYEKEDAPYERKHSE